MNGSDAKRNQSRSLHPARQRPDVTAPVLIIAQDEADRLELELLLHPPLLTRSVRAAADTEGRGVEVIVVGGAFPLAEVTEVRAHPQLFDKPVVLFVPGRTLTSLDWRSANVWPVTTDETASRDLNEVVCELLLNSPDLREAL
jgi:hypothetical protein